jgi:hypothetical protein
MLIAAVGALGGARDRRSMDNNRIASVGGTTARSNTQQYLKLFVNVFKQIEELAYRQAPRDLRVSDFKIHLIYEMNEL